jgi:hypothetical protein
VLVVQADPTAVHCRTGLIFAGSLPFLPSDSIARSPVQYAAGHLFALHQYRRDPPSSAQRPKQSMTVTLQDSATYFSPLPFAAASSSSSSAAAAATATQHNSLYTLKTYRFGEFLPQWAQAIVSADKLMVFFLFALCCQFLLCSTI